MPLATSLMLRSTREGASRSTHDGDPALVSRAALAPAGSRSPIHSRFRTPAGSTHSAGITPTPTGPIEGAGLQVGVPIQALPHDGGGFGRG
jgi:hypothetical protein